MPKKLEMKDDQNLDSEKILKYEIPIQHETYKTKEGKSEERKDKKKKKFKIKGEAIRETVSRNKIKYLADELREAFPTLNNKPILDTHNPHTIKASLGKVTDVNFDESIKGIRFEADIMDKDAIERIKDGRIENVSVSAMFDEILKEEITDDEDNVVDVHFIVKGLEFLELSLVTVPGVRSATIDQAITEAYQGQKQINKSNKKEESTMTDKKENKITLEDVKELLDKEVGTLSEQLNSLKDDKVDTKSLRKSLKEELKTEMRKEKLLSELKELKENGAKVDLEKSSEKSVEVLEETLSVLKENFNPKTEKDTTKEDKSESKGSLAPTNENKNNDKIVVEKAKEGFDIYGKVDSRGKFLALSRGEQ